MDRQAGRQQTQTDRQIYTQTQAERDRQIYTQTQAGRQRQTNIHTDTDRQTDRQRCMHAHDTHTHTPTHQTTPYT